MKRSIHRPPPLPTASSTLRAGAARIDITPVLGIPNGGYGIWGDTQTGVWQRLFCSVLVLETPTTSDQPSRRVAFVSTDLHAGTRYLHEAVASRASSVGVTVDRLMIGASHTHYGPSGIYSDNFYDRNAGAERGFMAEVMQWLVERIDRGIKEACGELTPARVGVGQSNLWGAGRNRSLEAFQANGVSPDELPGIYGLAGEVPDGLDEAELAIDPRVRIMCAFDAQDGTAIGAFGTVNVHNTTLLPMRQRFSSDWIGHAVRTAQERLYRLGGAWKDSPRLPMAVVYGNAGDTNPVVAPPGAAQMSDEEREDALYAARDARDMTRAVGDAYGRAFATACTAAQGLASANVEIRTRWVECEANARNELAPNPRVGAPTLGGAEGLRMAYARENLIKSPFPTQTMRNLSEWLHKNCPEPSPYPNPENPHHPKKIFPDDVFGKDEEIPDVGSLLLKTIQGRANSLFPLRVFSVGEHHWVGLPGEPTTFAGLQIERALAGPNGVLGGTAAVVGVCGDYIGYLTTKAEYQKQHYEGASTLWGPDTTDWLETRLRNLCSRQPTVAPEGYAEFPRSKELELEHERTQGDWERPGITKRDGEFVVWWITPRLRVWIGEGPVLTLEQLTAQGWEPARFRGVPIDDREYPIEIIRNGQVTGKFIWSGYFDPDAAMKRSLRGKTLRFKLTHPKFMQLEQRATATFQV